MSSNGSNDPDGEVEVVVKDEVLLDEVNLETEFCHMQ